MALLRQIIAVTLGICCFAVATNGYPVYRYLAFDFSTVYTGWFEESSCPIPNTLLLQMPAGVPEPPEHLLCTAVGSSGWYDAEARVYNFGDEGETVAVTAQCFAPWCPCFLKTASYTLKVIKVQVNCIDYLAVGGTKQLAATVNMPGPGGIWVWHREHNSPKAGFVDAGGNLYRDEYGNLVNNVIEPNPVIKGLEPSDWLNDMHVYPHYYFQTAAYNGDWVYTLSTDPFTVFGIVVSGPDRAYIGQKRDFTASVAPTALSSYLPNTVWSGGGNPSGGTGASFSTRFFWFGQRQIQASLTIADQTCVALKPLPVADIFMCAPQLGTNEYAGIYPGDPLFGAYASSLVSGGGWNLEFVQTSNGQGAADPVEPFPNAQWYDRFKGNFTARTSNLHNCKWITNTEPNPAFQGDGNSGLVEFDWKGFNPGIVYQDDLPGYDTYRHFVVGNCHGNSVHSVGVPVLDADSWDIIYYLFLFGFYPYAVEGLSLPSVVSQVQVGDVFAFGPTVGGAAHSGYVIEVGQPPSADNIKLWMNNCGIAPIAGGYGDGSIRQYLNNGHHYKLFSYVMLFPN
jgi:hypothetical protein